MTTINQPPSVVTVVPMKESREEAFKRLSAKRLKRTLEELRLLRQLASPNYAYSSRDAEHLVSDIAAAVTQVAQAFGIEFSAQVNKGLYMTTQLPHGFEPVRRELPALNNDGLEVVLRSLETDHVDEAVAVLRGALHGERRFVREVRTPGGSWPLMPVTGRKPSP
jgi:hypothetical protein